MHIYKALEKCSNTVQLAGWLVGWLILWHINLCRLFNAKSIFIQISNSISNNSVSVKQKYTVQSSVTVLFQVILFSQTVLIKTIQFSVSIGFVYALLNVKTVLFQTIQFSISTQFKVKTDLSQPIHITIGTEFKCQNKKYNDKAVFFSTIQFLFACLGLWHINLCWLFNTKSIFIQIN